MAWANVLFGLPELAPPAAVPTTATALATTTAPVAMMMMIRCMCRSPFVEVVARSSTFVLPSAAPDRLGCHHRCCVNVCARTAERPLQRGESCTRLNLSVLPVLLQV